MKINYALVCYKRIDNDNIQLKHACCYESKPTESDIDSLYEELATDEEFGMVGDDDFEMWEINRNDQPHAFEIFQIPLELN